MKKIVTALIVLITIKASAQAPAIHSSDDIYLQLKKLNVLGSVLYIAAHPDDENTRLLAWLAKGKQYRTGYLSLTRGDGGQNLIGDEQGIELGLIRTQELLAARRIDGAEQFFSRAYDFGFSKSSDEALRLWDHDKILSDVVWVIRKFKPDVIITRFPGDARAGHGQHSASSILAQEAFSAAADSTSFPEQFQYGVTHWQAKRIFWNTFNFGGFNTTSEDQLKVDIGEYNPLLGESYGEIASESRSQHRSQGFGVARQRGESFEYFQLLAGSPAKDSLLDGINTTWSSQSENFNNNEMVWNDMKRKIKESAGHSNQDSIVSIFKNRNSKNADLIQSMINRIIKDFNFEHPENSLDSLVSLYKIIQQSSSSYWKEQKLKELQNIILECAGIFAEATSNSEFAVKGDSLKVQFFVNKRNNTDVKLQSITLNAFDSILNISLPTNKNVTGSTSLYISPNTEVTQPYWLQKPMEGSIYDVDNQEMIGKPENDPAYTARFTVTIKGMTFFINAPVKYKYTDPVRGELYEPVVIITPVIVSASPDVALLNVVPMDSKPLNQEILIQYKSNIDAKHVPVTVKLMQGETTIFSKDTITNFEAGKVFSDVVSVKQYYNKNAGANLSINVTAQLNGRKLTFSHYLRSIEYEHIPHIHYFYRDNVKLITEEIKTKGRNIGYIVGAGDKVPQALQQMGYNVKLLNETDLTDNNLQQFDAVITGVRAYDVNDFLTSKYNVLMNYIRRGGNLIVQYNRSNLINNGTIKISPYPFAIASTRVTDETAPVNILQPNNPALNFPNKITQKDFDDWIQERSTYQAANVDAHYAALLGMNDPGEQQSNGSLVIAKYGKGNFVYTGLVFFRELPAGVAGAYRLMANLIALPQNNSK
ncbi:MAG: PIG-L family deacetylase [Ilyomonas sp.]